jgi:hypothetical protein
MPRYDFKSLSSQDFEELARDLLQAEWDVPLEAFKSGRDAGIDLRYAPAEGGATIVQCKHYVVSGFTKLLAHLRDEERPKVKKLAPHRYVVVTSVPLTPGNKGQIARALKPFVLGTRDVLGADDIEGLLSRHLRLSAPTSSYGLPALPCCSVSSTTPNSATRTSRSTEFAASSP